jgi:hypothetical protein
LLLLLMLLLKSIAWTQLAHFELAKMCLISG